MLAISVSGGWTVGFNSNARAADPFHQAARGMTGDDFLSGMAHGQAAVRGAGESAGRSDRQPRSKEPKLGRDFIGVIILGISTQCDFQEYGWHGNGFAGSGRVGPRHYETSGTSRARFLDGRSLPANGSIPLLPSTTPEITDFSGSAYENGIRRMALGKTSFLFGSWINPSAHSTDNMERVSYCLAICLRKRQQEFPTASL
jgi:hypothetical protein